MNLAMYQKHWTPLKAKYNNPNAIRMWHVLKPLQTLVSIVYNETINRNIATRVGCASPLSQTEKWSIPEHRDENTVAPPVGV